MMRTAPVATLIAGVVLLPLGSSGQEPRLKKLAARHADLFDPWGLKASERHQFYVPAKCPALGTIPYTGSNHEELIQEAVRGLYVVDAQGTIVDGELVQELPLTLSSRLGSVVATLRCDPATFKGRSVKTERPFTTFFQQEGGSERPLPNDCWLIEHIGYDRYLAHVPDDERHGLHRHFVRKCMSRRSE
ncbi:MAG: hypothetical protein OXG74_08605 [Acidobacteria bacterium]|nr:hypothetical protein [Acidobacteriota bacterium]